MELTGKKAVFLGDSITEGAGTSAKENIYLNVLAKTASLREAKNYGISGTRIAYQKEPYLEYVHLDALDYCKRFGEMDDDADIVVVFGGTNDYGHGDAPMGEMGDRTPDTFYGACHYLFCGLMEKYPTATIVVMTPLHRSDESAAASLPSKNAPLSAIVNAIREVAEFYSLPLVDLYATAGIQPQVEASRIALCPDGLHPNDEGHKIIASRLLGVLRAL